MNITRVGPVLGAELSGIDLSQEMSEATANEIRAALTEHEVVVFRNQTLSGVEQLDFGRRFGELVVSPFSPNADEAPELIVLDTSAGTQAPLTDIWHADETYRSEPPRYTILKALISPSLGGDTMFVSMRAAYEGLSDRMKSHVAGLTALHGFGRFARKFGATIEGRARLNAVESEFPHPSHPVVCVHPDSGHKVLYVNRHFTEYIVELPDDEGRAILDFLLSRTMVAEHQLRVSWQPGTVVMWDNRLVQHYAPFDYWPQRRRMERVTVAGNKPVGDGASADVEWGHVRVRGVVEEYVEEADQPTRQFERQ